MERPTTSACFEAIIKSEDSISNFYDALSLFQVNDEGMEALAALLALAED